MEFFDIVVLIFSLLSLFTKRISNISQKIYYSIFLLTLTTQLIFVGLKWQYYLIYVLFLYKSLAMVNNFEPSARYLKILDTTLSTSVLLIASLLIYVFPVPSFNATNDSLYSVGYEEHLIILDDRVNPPAFVELSNLTKNSKRELLVDIYYPSLEESSFNQIVRAGDANWGKYIVNYLNRTWELNLPDFILSHLKLTSFEVQKGLAPALGTKFPVVIYSHGWAGEKIFASDQLIHLASQGYVILAVDHVGLAMFTDLPSGIIFNTGSTENSSSITSVMTEMAKDIEHTMEFFRNPVSDVIASHEIVSSISDFENTSIIGHSTGGGAAVIYCSLHKCTHTILQDPFLTPFMNEGVKIKLENTTSVIYSQDWYDGYLDSETITEIEVFNTELVDQDVALHGYYMKDARHYDFVAFGAISPLTKYTFLKGTINYKDSLDVNNYFNSSVLKGEIPDENYSPYLISIKQ
jgi:dienelactone hydrolase